MAGTAKGAKDQIGFLALKGTAVRGKSSFFGDDRFLVDSTVLLITVFDRLSYSQKSRKTAYRDRLSYMRASPLSKTVLLCQIFLDPNINTSLILSKNLHSSFTL